MGEEAPMVELVELIVSKVGILEAQAQQAVEMVLDFLKRQLPAPVAGQIEAALEGDLSGLEDLLGGLGGLSLCFGRLISFLMSFRFFCVACIYTTFIPLYQRLLSANSQPTHSLL